MGKNSLTLNKPNFYFYFWKITTVHFITLDLIHKENKLFLYVPLIRIFVVSLNVNYFPDILMNTINIPYKLWLFITLFLSQNIQ